MTTKKKQMVLVTTDKRGVFAGELVSKARTGESTLSVRLRNARMCVYWSADVRGVFGLAVSGPTESCRISPPTQELTLEGVHAVSTMTGEAVAAWESEPWK